jgi:hypothetical protein
MATTTNYSWTTPDDTALVKDGAAAIRTLGSSIDTTTKALNPSTTLGDIEYRSSTANTNTRLALGTAGQLLAVNSGATAPEWKTVAAGAYTLLSTTTLSGASTITISGISQSYSDLFITVFGVTNATSNSGFALIPNGSSGNTDVSRLSTDSAWATNTNDNIGFAKGGALDPLRTDANNVWEVTLFGYSATNRYKPFQVFGGYKDTGSNNRTFISGGHVKSNTAISSFDITHFGGNFSTGTVLIYGVK